MQNFLSNYLIVTVLLIILVGVGGAASFTQAAPTQLEPVKRNLVRLDQLEEKAQNFVFFTSQALEKRDKVQVRFPYAFETEPLTLWLGFNPDDSAERLDYLVSQPQLFNLDWDRVDGAAISLYQRFPNYTSVDDFLANPPDPSTLVLDSHIRNRYPEFADSQITDFEFDLEKADYILTTYRHSELINGVLYFNRIIDATNAIVNDDGGLEWYLRRPDTEETLENPTKYYSGPIDINYIQY